MKTFIGANDGCGHLVMWELLEAAFRAIWTPSAAWWSEVPCRPPGWSRSRWTWAAGQQLSGGPRRAPAFVRGLNGLLLQTSESSLIDLWPFCHTCS